MNSRLQSGPVAVAVAVVLVLFFGGDGADAANDFRDFPGRYCEIRRPVGCCPGRDDECTVPIFGTLCYCDMFCDRATGGDCCPDFEPVCKGIPRPRPQPPPQEVKACLFKGKTYAPHKVLQVNCNKCTCTEQSDGRMEMICGDQPCLIRKDIIDGVNTGRYGWQSGNYSFFWGRTLDEGVRHKLGTFKPEQLVMDMHGISVSTDHGLDERFDARQQWPRYIQPIRDQGECGSSWAVSTVDVAADRLAILTKGEEQMALSPQHLLSCLNKKNRGCDGGYTDRAWRFISDHGVVSEDCYPYTSGHDGQIGHCQIPTGSDPDHVRCVGVGDGLIYKSPPPYRISPSEVDIMREIKNNGPVQAMFLVREDFYSYHGGVYRYSKLFPNSPDSHRKAGYHSTRIIGWGVDRSQGRPVKYWLCANSWGSQWGEDGFFRIVRGEDECQIEMFVVGVWAKRSNHDDNGF